MSPSELTARLERFVEEESFYGKGPLCVSLVVTRQACDKGLPLDPPNLLTERGGQVLGLGKGAVQKILADHGIKRVLAAEGGRTSRGSIDNMRAYVELLNELHSLGSADLDAIERFWVEQVRRYFNQRPFKLKYDQSKGLREVVRDIFDQAVERQKEAGGTMYAGAVLQHLVGAKLDCALGLGAFEHNSFSFQSLLIRNGLTVNPCRRGSPISKCFKSPLSSRIPAIALTAACLVCARLRAQVQTTNICQPSSFKVE
ncbi:MAG: DUF4928 family protein [Opitutales bacterium]